MSDTLNTAEPRKRRRRWFQFGLRTLLVAVTILAVACGYVAHVRRIVLVRRSTNGHSQFLLDLPPSMQFGNERVSERNQAADPSWIRRLLGDEAYPTILVTSDENSVESTIAMTKVLFPESEIWLKQVR